MYQRGYGIYHDKTVTVQQLLNETYTETVRQLDNQADKAAHAVFEAATEANRDILAILEQRYGHVPLYVGSVEKESEVGKAMEAARSAFAPAKEALMDSYQRTCIALGLGKGSDAKLAILERFKAKIKNLVVAPELVTAGSSNPENN